MQSDIVQRLMEWGDLPSSVEFLDSVEAIFDPSNRHKSGAKPTVYLASWISMLRPYAYATKDDSWGELEKILCIVMRNYVQVRRDAGAAAAEIERNRATIAALEASLHAAEECEKALREALERIGDEDMQLLAFEVMEIARQAIAGAKP